MIFVRYKALLILKFYIALLSNQLNNKRNISFDTTQRFYIPLTQQHQISIKRLNRIK